MFGQDITIVITCKADGTINVNGPLENRVLMFGLLEVARETVSKFNDAAQKAAVEQRVVTVPPGFTVPDISRNG